MEIPLNNSNLLAYVSEEDYHSVVEHTWHENENGYAKSGINGKNVSMHKFIMGKQDGMVIDHKNSNRLDNRRENLRFLTREQNSQNQKKRENASSKYYGVCFNQAEKHYASKFTLNGKQIYLGIFDNEIDAAETYDKYILHANLTHKTLNFPEKKEEYLKNPYCQQINKNTIRKTSKYIGVGKYKGNRFSTTVYNGGKQTVVFTSLSEEECAHKYDEYIVTNNIPKKKLNFPHNYPNYDPNKIITIPYEIINDTTIRLIYKDLNILIDKGDYDKIKYFTLSMNEVYVYLKVENKLVGLHRYLKNVTDPNVFIDHIDSNPLNNTKQNLRLSDNNKNAQNKKKRRGCTSQFIGVCLIKSQNIWLSSITVKSIFIRLGVFKDEEIAARKRDLYIINELPDSHYKLNFVWSDEDKLKWTNYFNI